MKQKLLQEFDGCCWLWYDHYGFDDVNVYMLARKDFKLNKIPEKAEISITADSRYKLYVNGMYVTYGPARGFPESYPFDRVDIAPYLQKGKNVIGVIVHQFGHGTFQYIYAGASGLLVSGKVGTVDVGTKKGNWLIKKCSAYKQDMARRTIQLGYQDNLDAEKLEADWLLPAKIVEYGKNGWEYGLSRPVGCAPWLNIEERGIPLLGNVERDYKQILSVHSGNCSSDWQSARNLTVLYLSEKKGKQDSSKLKNADSILENNSSFATVLPFSSRKKLTVLIDFGEEVVGFLGIEVEGNGGEVIDFTAAESLENEKLCIASETASKVAVSDRYIARKGSQTYETFSIHGFRYLSMTLRNVKSPLKIRRIYVRETVYPFDRKTVFETSDSLLNDIWDISVRTQVCCSLDAFVDCPWREQAQWWGDARVQAANTYYAFGDMRLFARGIRQAGQSQLSNGLTYGHFPTIAVGCILPDFTLTWIQSHLDYYTYTGNSSLIKEQFDQMEKAMKFFADYINKNYLLGPMPEWWLFLDWAPLYKEGWSCFFNLLYLASLRYMVTFCGILQKPEKKKFYLSEAGKIEKRIQKVFWDNKKHVFRDGYDTKKKNPVPAVSQHTHTWGILLGLQKQYHKFWAEQIILPIMQGAPVSQPQNFNKESGKMPSVIEGSPFYYYYIQEAMKQAGPYGGQIVDFIKRRWGQMLKEGSTTCYETWHPRPGGGSLCHAWSAHPIVNFVELVAGIKPLSPEWKKIKVNPNPLKLKHLRISIPVQNGTIELESSGNKNKLRVPKNIKLLRSGK